MTHENIKNALQNIIKNSTSNLEIFVAKEALEYYDTKNFFSDLFHIGCVSGMINSLCFYNQTHTFYDEHYDEIEELRFEYESNTGLYVPIHFDLKNSYAWFAFEETAYKLASKLKIDF